ncbi:MAG: glucuronate isomerase [Clostridia bacterium]|nr:glucuronate isomerase [Clostridia bacterium]
MRKYLDDSYLLCNATAERLYHDFAKHMPIYDYHCHLSPKEIAEDKKFKNITELWLAGDHYKWRAMRSNGIEETYITGGASDKEKFIKWAETMPQCIGNPLHHWTHLELRRFFGIDKLLSPDTADEIWQECNKRLEEPGFSARGLIKRSNVKVICTTDDPLDSLEYHKAILQDRSFDVKVLPAFRPDKSFNIEKEGFVSWIGKLSYLTGINIQSFEELKAALGKRIEFFHQAGCRISDHALDPVVFMDGTEDEASETLKRALKGEQICDIDLKKYKTQVMLFLGRQYARYGWVMQLHIGTIRNNNSRMFRALGPDTGFDAIGDEPIAQPLAKLLESLDDTDELPKTILYCLNPSVNEVLGTIMGCFQGGGIPGKIQFGSAWWFNDHKDGMIRQMTALANLGLLSRFVGMLTDSRSFLSYTRHEYFRRILCSLLGEWVEKGEAPEDSELLGRIISNICYNNAKQYFGI